MHTNKSTQVSFPYPDLSLQVGLHTFFLIYIFFKVK